MFYENWNDCRADAQRTANASNVFVRLRKVNEFGKEGYRFYMVPLPENQYGHDLEGELITPDQFYKKMSHT